MKADVYQKEVAGARNDPRFWVRFSGWQVTSFGYKNERCLFVEYITIFDRSVKADNQSEFEWQTRKARIDPKLVALGWTLVRWTPDHYTPPIFVLAVEDAGDIMAAEAHP
jgi:hypothetical protein